MYTMKALQVTHFSCKNGNFLELPFLEYTIYKNAKSNVEVTTLDLRCNTYIQLSLNYFFCYASKYYDIILLLRI